MPLTDQTMALQQLWRETMVCRPQFHATLAKPNHDCSLRAVAIGCETMQAVLLAHAHQVETMFKLSSHCQNNDVVTSVTREGVCQSIY